MIGVQSLVRELCVWACSLSLSGLGFSHSHGHGSVGGKVLIEGEAVALADLVEERVSLGSLIRRRLDIGTLASSLLSLLGEEVEELFHVEAAIAVGVALGEFVADALHMVCAVVGIVLVLLTACLAGSELLWGSVLLPVVVALEAEGLELFGELRGDSDHFVFWEWFA